MKFDRLSNQTTIMQIAAIAHVSLATVSRVTNHPEKVKPETRARVEKAIRDRGYTPNLNAKSLAISKSKTVAVIVPELTRSSIAGLVDGISDCAKSRGYLLRLFVNKPGSTSYIDEEAYWSTIMSTIVDGILYINDELTQENINLIKKTPVPVVVTNAVVEDETVPYVSLDYYKAAYDITTEMIKRGNKKIWMITATKNYVANGLKVKGYTQAMLDNNLTPIVKPVSGKIEIHQETYKDLLKEDIPDVAIVVRDSMAVSLINVARSLGISVPDKMQVIGFQNTKYAELSYPSLTCVETPIYALGEKAMDILSEMMSVEEDEEIEIETKNFIDSSIIWRNSTK